MKFKYDMNNKVYIKYFLAFFLNSKGKNKDGEDKFNEITL